MTNVDPQRRRRMIRHSSRLTSTEYGMSFLVFTLTLTVLIGQNCAFDLTVRHLQQQPAVPPRASVSSRACRNARRRRRPSTSPNTIIYRPGNLPSSGVMLFQSSRSVLISENESNSTSTFVSNEPSSSSSSSSYKDEFRIEEDRKENDHDHGEEDISTSHQYAETKRGKLTCNPSTRRSRITRIICRNLGGMRGGVGLAGSSEKSQEQVQVVLDFNPIRIESDKSDGKDSLMTNVSDLIAVTGESGTGKSLLVWKAIDLATGGKASSSILLLDDSNHLSPSEAQLGSTTLSRITASVSSVEMDLSLNEHQAEALKTQLASLGLDPNKILSPLINERNHASKDIDESAMTTLNLRRDISLVPTGQSSPSARVKSTCFVNGHPVTLKTLRAIGVPLVALVNAPVATSALGNPSSRLAMIDAGVPVEVRKWVQHLYLNYKRCLKYRQSLEHELQQQVLPTSLIRPQLSGKSYTDGDVYGNDDNDLYLLRHWTEELDGFESRMIAFRDSLAPKGVSSLEEDGSELAHILLDLIECEWVSDSESSKMYSLLLDLSDSVKKLDSKIDAAMTARESLSSLSKPDSALTALEKTRRFLIETQTAKRSARADVPTKAGLAAERAHDLLNQVEEAISAWSSFMDDDEKGLVATLKSTRNLCSPSVEQLAERITEWNTLARKHGISSYQLPMCHATLKKQLDGGLEATLLLPKAREDESNALQKLQEGYRVLTKARRKICSHVSESISKRFPGLGLGNSRFEARLLTTDNPSYDSFPLGADVIDFLLHHDGGASSSSEPATSRASTSQGGKLEDVASSGEKARIVLAIECEIPGSIRALCNVGSSSSYPGIVNGSSIGFTTSAGDAISPVAVIYDEIDAHVGGNASVAVAQMLLDQSRSCQVMSITHSPSVAAIADVHVCIQRDRHRNGKPSTLSASQVTDIERRRELARILSGDMATDEAEAFAAALLREASAKKRRMS